MQLSSIGLRSMRLSAHAIPRSTHLVNSVRRLSRTAGLLQSRSSTATERASNVAQARQFHQNSKNFASEPIVPHVTQATPLSIDQYHKLADDYLDSLIEELEELQDERDEVDVEYSAGVLTLIFPPAGTYVLNTQPPNRQIWLSSPVSGPKRYDYVEKEEGGSEWIYLRDGSSLSELMRQEVGIKLEKVR